MGLVAPGAGLAALLLASDAQAHTPGPGLLRRSWRAYERRFIQDDGRVIDWRDHEVTTSEGQAYALSRAAWIGDKDAFDRLLRWTRDNLQEGDPTALPAWRWGQRPDGSWGIIDRQPAADADVWMAQALLTAADRWDEPRYRGQAVGMIANIWEQEVAQVGPWRVLLPGPWARNDQPVPVNPSYWLLPAFRSFAVVDPERPWSELLDHAYVLLGAWMAGGQLPSDWVHLDPQTGVRVADPESRPEGRLFGVEAMRIPWTLAAEVAWHDETRARYLLVPFADLGRHWRKTGRIPARMEPEGTGVVDWEYPGLYGMLLPAWACARPEDADALYEQSIRPLQARRAWGDSRDYYAQNLVWMGIALWQGLARPPEVRP